ncbi:hypothetical protein LA080_004668 [Diaporthe eres]|nr:hypothetical protein LA080_004668 [Diaporthe eres]
MTGSMTSDDNQSRWLLPLSVSQDPLGQLQAALVPPFIQESGINDYQDNVPVAHDLTAAFPAIKATVRFTLKLMRDMRRLRHKSTCRQVVEALRYILKKLPKMGLQGATKYKTAGLRGSTGREPLL